MASEYKNELQHLPTASAMIDVLTAPAGKSNIIKLIQATNVTSSAATLDLAVSSSGQFYLAKDISINSQASYVVVDDPVVLEAGDKLQAKCANIHNGLDLVVSYLQVSSSIS